VEEPVEVLSLREQNGRVTGVRTVSGEIAADCVIVAAGAWSKRLLGPFGKCLELEPVRGQMLLYSGEPGMLRHILLRDEYYLVPRRDGQILAGSTVERVGFDVATTTAGRAELRAAAESLVPSLRDLPIVGHWAGLRPGSPDGVPVIGPHPDIEGLYLNTGHYRNGVLLAPGSARLLADLILGREPIVPPESFSLGARLSGQG
jgi:glycine oxidase